MPFKWTPENERQMLLLTIASADLAPTTATWDLVAAGLQDGSTNEPSANAVSQKYFKLKRELKAQGTGAPAATSTPTKAAKTNGAAKTPRKRKTKADGDVQTPNKRTKSEKSEMTSDELGDSEDTTVKAEVKAEEKGEGDD